MVRKNWLCRGVWYSLLLLVVSFTRAGLAEPAHTVRSAGDPANRLDLVVVGDGYTAAEQGKFASDVARLMEGFFTEEPFAEYRNYFNVHRVDVVSAQSGADHDGVERNTRFNAHYNCQSIQRLICVDIGKVKAVVESSLPPNARDFIIVLVNDTEYGGSGGEVAVASLDTLAVHLILHEFGHSFGLLADEYGDGESVEQPSCESLVEPEEPNVTRVKERASVKWNRGGGPPTGWIEQATELPTIYNGDNVVGLFEGARYCAHKLYRPTYISKMRNVEAPFERINEEQLIKRMYNWVSPIDEAVPSSTTVNLAASTSQTFRIKLPAPTTHSLQTVWYVDEEERGRGVELALDAKDYPSGKHSVQVKVRDPIKKVRSDEENLLKAARSWEVKIEEVPPVPFAEFHAKVEVSPRPRPQGNFIIKGMLRLGPASDGIRPRREAIVVSLENDSGPVFSQTLSPNVLARKTAGIYTFDSTQPRFGINHIVVKALPVPGMFRFRVEGQRLNLAYLPLLNNVTVKLQIGNDAQRFQTSCRLERRRVRCL